MRPRLFEPLTAAARRPLLPVAGAGWAFAVGVFGAMGVAGVRTFSRMPSWERLAFVLLGTSMVTLALTWTSRRRKSVACYWAFQSLAAVVLTVASRGHGALILLPVLAQTAFLAPRRFVLAFAACLAAVALLATNLRTRSWAAAANLSAGHLAGILFVVAFTELLLRERQAHAQNEALAVALATNRERTRVAREVHDIVGHSLTAVHAQLTGALALRERDGARSAELVESARALTEDGLKEIRRSVSSLRDDARGPLIEALRSLLSTAQTTGLTTELVIEGPLSEPPAAASLALYRMLQECITNSIRHGKASRLRATLSQRAAYIELCVEDDGQGTQPIVPGAGLKGLEERITSLGGEIEIAASAGKGVRLAARIPHPSNQRPT